LPNGMVHILKP